MHIVITGASRGIGASLADISVEVSAQGLTQRSEALDLETTGCFETWDGRAHAY